MTFGVTSSDHQPVVGYNPWGIGVEGGIFSGAFPTDVDTLVTQGGCPAPLAFDVLQADGPDAVVEMNYHDWGRGSATAPAVLSQTSENSGAVMVGFVLSGFSFHDIRDQKLDGLPDRFYHMEGILNYLGLLTSAGDVPNSNPARYRLAQNVPNPFNPATTIRYELEESGVVSLRVYNVAGQLVRTLVDGHRAAGQVYEAVWNGRNDAGQTVSSGVYFYKLSSEGFAKTKKMILLK
jgi:hypothetical protein